MEYFGFLLFLEVFQFYFFCFCGVAFLLSIFSFSVQDASPEAFNFNEYFNYIFCFSKHIHSSGSFSYIQLALILAFFFPVKLVCFFETKLFNKLKYFPTSKPFVTHHPYYRNLICKMKLCSIKKHHTSSVSHYYLGYTDTLNKHHFEWYHIELNQR